MIEIKDGKVTCSKLSIDIDAATCAKCKYNMLEQFVEKTEQDETKFVSVCMA